MSPRPHVIILNGVGSVGESSTAKALQAITAQPFLHVALDAFLDMLPADMLAHPGGLLFEATQAGGKPVAANLDRPDPRPCHARNAARRRRDGVRALSSRAPWV